MNYTSQFDSLRIQFNPLLCPDTGISSSPICQWFGFHSESPMPVIEGKAHNNASVASELLVEDFGIKENQEFRYPVFPGNDTNRSRPILLLHGLNERSWNKYLPWASTLAEQTGRPVILFPIAFHMNRSPAAWADPHKMSMLVAERQNRLGKIPYATFVNVALSERLTEDPSRFLTSGSQSAEDIIQLARQLKSGKHPYFPAGTEFDIFGYSIGSFLAQVLLLANPEGLFSNCRLFVFCGGVLFDDMQGTSKFIMDEVAFVSLKKYYHSAYEKDEKFRFKNARMHIESGLTRAFGAMISRERGKSFRDSRFGQISDQIHSVALRQDTVFPSDCLQYAIPKSCNMEVMDFPFQYSHESPFPIFRNSLSAEVDACFNKIFAKAASFLA
ncbi:MAG: hypothetical protein IPH88_04375 [Bacteroidales bacterium]|nr:hypothetical protein [Bacteroidales bacterium]